MILFLHDYGPAPLADLVCFGRHIHLGRLQMMIGKVAYLDRLLLLLNYAASEVGQQVSQLLLLFALDGGRRSMGVVYGDFGREKGQRLVVEGGCTILRCQKGLILILVCWC